MKLNIFVNGKLSQVIENSYITSIRISDDCEIKSDLPINLKDDKKVIESIIWIGKKKWIEDYQEKK